MAQPQQTIDQRPSMPFQTDEQITAREVARITGLSRKRIVEAARLGHLTTFRPPAGMAGLVRIFSPVGRSSGRFNGYACHCPASPADGGDLR